MRSNQRGGACLDELERSTNVVKAASVAWRTLSHDAESTEEFRRAIEEGLCRPEFKSDLVLVNVESGEARQVVSGENRLYTTG